MSGVRGFLRRKGPEDRKNTAEEHTPAPPSNGGSGGYGLVLLDRLSDRWGVQREGAFSVWFEVQRDRLPFGDDRSPRARTA